MEPNMPLINLVAYVYEPAPVAGPHRALGPEVGRGKSFIGPPMAVVLYGPDNPMIDALEPPKATLGAQMRHRGEAGPQRPPSQPLWRFQWLYSQGRILIKVTRVHLETFKGGGRSPKRRFRGPMGQRIQSKSSLVPLGPMGLTQPHRLLMSQGPTGFWGYRGPVSPCQAF